MAFLIVDNKKGNIFDILDSRKSRDLEKYFRRYPRYIRDKVKFISTDFYSGYIYLANKLFRKAKIVIDPFHIVTQCYVSLNSTRISLCKKDNPNYNKLKDLWKLFIKNENDLSIRMKKALKLYRDNIKYIENTFNYDINNGIIEGTNNLIKAIKRIAFGYKRFDHFVSRIFLIKGIIKGVILIIP